MTLRYWSCADCNHVGSRLTEAATRLPVRCLGCSNRRERKLADERRIASGKPTRLASFLAQKRFA